MSTARKRVQEPSERPDASTGLDNVSKVPLYHQLFVLLRNRIYDGSLPTGSLTPGEQDLCREFGISRITAKRALNELAEAGLVVRERGIGTRVIKRPPVQAITSSIEGWLENMSLMDKSTRVEVLAFDYRPANADVAQALSIDVGEDVQYAERLRYLDGEPLSHLSTHVPADIGRQYKRSELGKHALLHLLERVGVHVASARQSISAVIADGAVAESLQVHAGSPLIEVKRVVEDDGHRPVEFIRVLYRPDLYRFEMSMRRIHDDDQARWSAH